MKRCLLITLISWVAIIYYSSPIAEATDIVDSLSLRKTIVKPEINYSYKMDYSKYRIELLKKYAEMHYSGYYKKTSGSPEWPGIEIQPRVIVVHYTETKDAAYVARSIKIDTLTGREDIKKSGIANVGMHFVVEQDGVIFQTLEDNHFARHCIGLSHCAISIENVGYSDLSIGEVTDENEIKKPLNMNQVNSNAELIRYLKNKYPDIEILIGHQEYRQLEKPSHPGYKYFHENDPNYRTTKVDPGSYFMQTLREGLKDILIPNSNGQVFVDN